MQSDRTYLFEQAPVSKAVLSMAMPTIASSLVMVLYNLADTYFVGMLNNPVQNAAVTLVAPVLLAFNAINNLFGVGSSSMMSRRWAGAINKPPARVRPLASGAHCSAGR